jgi:glycosyltransferase involved in cell wall biosynthesis
VQKDLKISVITVCLNSEKYLEETINSVSRQTYKHIEYIVIDGGSTDNTINIIKRNQNFIAYWCSEPDDGMYHAINYGLKIATGDYLLILNSDDFLVNDRVIEEVVSEIQKENLDYYYGNLIKLENGKCKKVKLFNVSFKQLLLSTHGTFAPHPCFFISKMLNQQLGGYNTAFKYAADFDYILRALENSNRKGKHIDTYITFFRMHEDSITWSGKIDAERLEILKKFGYKNFSSPERLSSYYFSWIYYKLINTFHFYQSR